jgi:hypothetical protein
VPLEHQALWLLRSALREQCPHEYKRGISEDGTPWAAFYHLATGEIIAHISRSANGYTLMWSDRRRFEVERLDSLNGMLRWAGRAAQAIQHHSPPMHYSDPTYL